MKYLCLVRSERGPSGASSDGEPMPIDEEHGGNAYPADALRSFQTAAIVRVRNGQVSVTDGPLAETKEQGSWYFLIDAKDLNDAIRIVSKTPAAHASSVEVRPIGKLNESDPWQARAPNARS